MRKKATVNLAELISLRNQYQACLPKPEEEAKEFSRKQAQVLQAEGEITQFVEDYQSDHKIAYENIPIDQALARNYVQACVEHVELLDPSKKTSFLKSASDFLSLLPEKRIEKEKKIEVQDRAISKKDKSVVGLAHSETRKPQDLVAVYKPLVKEGDRIRQKFQNPDQHHKLKKFGIFAESKNAVGAMAFDLITHKEYKAPPQSETSQIKNDFKLAAKLQKQEIAGFFAKKAPKGDYELAKRLQEQENRIFSKKN